MSNATTVMDILLAPLPAKWTIEGLAEQVLQFAATHLGRSTTTSDKEIFEPQVKRLLRPLIACLVNKSAIETGTNLNIYEGNFQFLRKVGDTDVTIRGKYQNQPGAVELTLLAKPAKVLSKIRSRPTNR